MKYRTESDSRKHFYCDSGTHDVPVFSYDPEKCSLVRNGSTSLFDEIQSHKDDVLLSNILKRCAITGETFEAPVEAFGDSSVLPKSLLEAKVAVDSVSNFEKSLDSDELSLLREKGFDDFIKLKIDEYIATQKGDSDE